jgi:hypothetical protein
VTTYAVMWREPDGQTFSGRLTLGPRALGLDGRRRGTSEPPVSRRIGYDELRGLKVGTGGAERLGGRPSLVVEHPDGAFLVADAGLGAPIIQEVIDRLAKLVPDAGRAARTLRLTRSRSVFRPG